MSDGEIAIADQRKTQRLTAVAEREADVLERKNADLAQSDRRARAFAERDLQASKGVTREADRAAMYARPGNRQIVPAVAPPPAAPGTAGMAGATGAPGATAVPPTGQQYVMPPGPVEFNQRSPFDTSPTYNRPGPAAPTAAGGGYPTSGPVAVMPGAPGPAGQPGVQAVAPAAAEDARLAASVGGRYPMQDANAMNARVQAIEDVQAGRATFVDPNRTSPGGVAGIQGGAPGVRYNQPRVQAVAPAPAPLPDPVATFGTLETAYRGTPADPTRLAALNAEVAKGQAALDSGTSLEAQQRTADAEAQHRRTTELATAVNPPRGTTSQPRPALAPEKKAKIDALMVRMRAATDDAARVGIQGEIDNELRDVPRATLVDLFKQAAGLGGTRVEGATPAPAGGPEKLPLNVASAAPVALPANTAEYKPGTVYKTPKGNGRFLRFTPDGKPEFEEVQ